MPTYISLVEPTDASGIAAIRGLLHLYLDWLGPLVCSSTLPGEIASLPEPYASPEGALFIARDEQGTALGCVGIRASEHDACEIKRLYVREDARRQGIGKALVRAAMDQARALGYREMRLTTLPDEMPGVQAMYRSLGFEDAEPYHHHGGSAADGVLLTYMRRGL
ncbi:MAG: N-acetyltransferase [Actinobacteria bacterium]|nr:N-acetyltransferase [Actinomycetota bacterium]